MNWDILNSGEQLRGISDESRQKTVLIFKHSTRCSISMSALDRVERNWNDEELKNEVKAYFLDLLTFRDVSLKIEEMFGVIHESPQVLVIRNGEAIYHASHFAINYKTIKEVINQELTNTAAR